MKVNFSTSLTVESKSSKELRRDSRESKTSNQNTRKSTSAWRVSWSVSITPTLRSTPTLIILSTNWTFTTLKIAIEESINKKLLISSRANNRRQKRKRSSMTKEKMRMPCSRTVTTKCVRPRMDSVTNGSQVMPRLTEISSQTKMMTRKKMLKTKMKTMMRLLKSRMRMKRTVITISEILSTTPKLLLYLRGAYSYSLILIFNTNLKIGTLTQ